MRSALMNFNRGAGVALTKCLSIQGAVTWATKAFATAIILGLSAGTAWADTVVTGGNLPQTTIWTKAASPYIVQGDVTVLESGMLRMPAAAHLQR